ncbi:50S ribosomal protein L3 [Candidatus Roizmanbacteria bacterium RIFCSPLOWO2_12_FULL_40_12]|uniref:Large ribosomal subunit protein uL3 n=1 Tax=Candidatus Roizmanbacteria bacterium RIFCSPLOWO2_01_FULL_40_42 TaxID=1802066 RepID=A0A1F7J4I0_9BACT|nr:MAG: 50S ribosomal protein L3 [Candidatus Roizmanbacteria bacterium RIFCSPHIGHO2_01_FULL_40_98]OGK27273.1 MAG: 50S ribosomal protein L3 [Candidatus Roizmanbacteria bacterium RIFCSPHIGHO2_02_FULL_40_53]OGK30855.1 MAG: 50S ribosomal protein L3 [Candidatus Roizmanbacteria bacterium RIFCSPHIGHO2_12_41_18]OGK36378.1 MAG: 50S ribosomal protein L3 [Candidatus Roizmanbacteria bacterium RIFCSPHIGHO2_12_FULL_40_130]OGK50506.1 MAG: 50S ribosomal protein L3 [Candidatus Roizmanbacteria bacterium RIFCSPLO
MSGFILGEKTDQSQRFTEDGDRIPVTFVRTNPCYLIGIKTKDKDGYQALKLGFGSVKNIKKPTAGELKKAGIEAPLHFLSEIRLDGYEGQFEFIEENGKRGVKLGETTVYTGQEMKPSQLFQKGELVDVTGTSKGKGFQGVVKRHGFAGGPKTHGQSDRWRAPGSIGQSATPGRVYKGKKMAGRMGSATVTVRKLQVVETADDHIVLKGTLPGGKKGLLEVRTSR